MKSRLLLASFLLLTFVACKKTEEFSTAAIAEYYPLETGKYITYKIDSLIYTNFGTSDTIRSYEVKYLTDSLITDNLGRPAYRIFRYIRANSTDAWQPDNTFLAVNTGTSLEFTENNMRFIKLKQPIRNEYSWKGNSFIDTYSFNSEVRYMDDWDYTYENVGETETIGTYNLDKTLKVTQRDEVIGNPDDPGSYSEKNISNEIYATGIGLVYKYFLHNEYQPPTTPTGVGYTNGYGVTLTMIDHN